MSKGILLIGKVSLGCLLFALTIFGFGGCASGNAPSRYHAVVAGETLESIANSYGIDSWDLAKANRMSSVSEEVAPGTKLYIPYDISKLRGYENRMEVPLPSAFSFQWPLEKVAINEYFGWRPGRMHEGVDLKASVGTPVFAAADGKVIYVGSKWHAYGKMLVIQHAENWSSIYAHLSSFEVGVGESIRRGDLIAKSGRTGRVTGPHLHFELRKGADPVDPLLFLPSKN